MRAERDSAWGARGPRRLMGRLAGGAGRGGIVEGPGILTPGPPRYKERGTGPQGEAGGPAAVPGAARTADPGAERKAAPGGCLPGAKARAGELAEARGGRPWTGNLIIGVPGKKEPP
jgi:hypothetical protein